MVHVHARITVKPEAAAAARAALLTLASETRKEPGCVTYDLFQQADAPHVFSTVEQWKDQAAVDGHMKSTHLAAAFAAAGPLLTAPPEIVTVEKIA